MLLSTIGYTLICTKMQDYGDGIRVIHLCIVLAKLMALEERTDSGYRQVYL
jgi:hypothetical protein